MKYIVGINGLYRADAVHFKVDKFHDEDDKECNYLMIAMGTKELEDFAIPIDKTQDILIDLAKNILESPSGIIMSEFLKKWRE